LSVSAFLAASSLSFAVMTRSLLAIVRVFSFALHEARQLDRAIKVKLHVAERHVQKDFGTDVKKPG
jgi:hypothetical protein